MPVEAKLTPPQEAPLSGPQLIDNILKGEIGEADQKMLKEKSAYYNSVEGDRNTIDSISKLRDEIEPMESWKKTAAEARKEVATLPSDILEKLMKEFSPYIKNLPAGHGRGHFLRDSMNLSLILQDPTINRFPPEEVVAGIIGAMYHDIGNSVVNRYQEEDRLSAHAEVGADLFAKVAQGIVPQNLLRMAQMSIAGHTHYGKDAVIIRDNASGEIIKPDVFEMTTSDGGTIPDGAFNGDVKLKDKTSGNVTTKSITRRVRKASEAKIDTDGSQAAMWISRWTDRLDTRGVPHAIRHIITKAVPTKDFDGTNFDKNDSNDRAEFQKQFEPVLDPTKKNILNHLKLFADNDTNGQNIYNQYDSEFMKQKLFGFENANQREFIETVQDVQGKIPPLTDEERKRVQKEGLAKFITLAGILEPANDLQKQIDTLKMEFPAVGEAQINWMHGFVQMFDKIYPEAYGRKKLMLETKPTLRFADSAMTDKVNDIVGNHLYPMAVEIVRKMERGPAPTLS